MEELFGSVLPYLTVVVLGLVVSFCPCSIAANVSALSCMLRQNTTRYFNVVTSYILARSIAYSFVGILLIKWVDQIVLTDTTVAWLGRVAGPLFILIGLFLMDIFHIHGLENRCVVWMNRVFRGDYSVLSAFLLGMILAFAVCPYSLAIYFGTMVPMACQTSYGLILPILFSIGAALPIAFIAWIFYNGVEKKLGIWKRFQTFEKWFRRTLAVLFILTGLLFVWEYFIE